MPAPMIHSVAETIFSELNNFTLLTIPLFVLMGAAIGKTRAGVGCIQLPQSWMHRIPGGLGLANVFACAVFAAMCGSSPATCSAIGSSGIPQLIKRGYSQGLAAGLIAAGGTLGILIPPSITLILYGLASEQSIGRLFMAGIGPGILLVMLFAFWVMFKYSMERKSAFAAVGTARHAIMEDRPFHLARTHGVPAAAVALRDPDRRHHDRPVWRHGYALGSRRHRGGRRRDHGGDRLPLLAERGSQSHIFPVRSAKARMIMMIIATSALFTFVMSYLGVTQQAATWLVGLGLSKWAFFFGVNIFLVVLGFFLPPVAIILMVTPIILPSLKAMGIDLIWFGIIMTILMEMGLIHPPVGLNLFVINGIAPDIRLKTIIWGTLPFIGLMVLGIFILCLIPDIAVWLPNHFYKGS